jgi:hypothetical protein
MTDPSGRVAVLGGVGTEAGFNTAMGMGEAGLGDAATGAGLVGDEMVVMGLAEVAVPPLMVYAAAALVLCEGVNVLADDACSDAITKLTTFLWSHIVPIQIGGSAPGSGGDSSSVPKPAATTATSTDSRSSGVSDDDEDSPMTVYRAPRRGNGQDEVENGLRISRHLEGNGLAHVGSRNVAMSFAGHGPYEDRIVRFDLRSQKQFRGMFACFPYGGIAGGEECEIPVALIPAFNAMTTSRRWD